MGQPILRWAGSKRKLLPLLLKATPRNFSRYIEPFAGSAVFFLELDASVAILNDLNEELILAYKTIRNYPKAVWKRASSMSHDVDFYYELRAKNPADLSKLDRAARFVYLNRFCFNGVYRTNLKGQFNVPRGSGHLSIPSLDVFKEFAYRLRKIELYNMDFEKVVENASLGDFIYLDPPYALGAKRSSGEYGCDSFKEKDEDRLIRSLLGASERGAKILLSYSPSSYIQEELKSWKKYKISVNRSVAGFIGSRRKADEILMSNYNWNN